MKVKEAVAFIMQKMGKELPENLYYHSILHINDVMESAKKLATLENIAEHEKNLLYTAVAYHDSGFIYQVNDHELKGCEIVRNVLPDFNYQESDIETICDMIMATKIPQNPQNLLEEIICDADLDYLGREDFWEIGNKLYNELTHLGVLENEEQWNRLQKKFLSSHNYFTNSAKSLREETKRKYLEKINNIVESYKSI
jgi:predicted metal-dependent HD superfamily phosphohydrolase